jgi:hypothetical protein
MRFTPKLGPSDRGPSMSEDVLLTFSSCSCFSSSSSSFVEPNLGSTAHAYGLTIDYRAPPAASLRYRSSSALPANITLTDARSVAASAPTPTPARVRELQTRAADMSA